MEELNSLSFRLKRTSQRCELWILDQTLLPHQEVWLSLETVEAAISAIQNLQVRGAPLIGVLASFALAQAALKGMAFSELQQALRRLAAARPTAVNLQVCLARMQKMLIEGGSSKDLWDVALALFREDVALCDRIAELGATLISEGDQILTHCNTGGLATVGCGTALGIIHRASQQGKTIHVYVDETRPLLQGARLTAWELERLGIPYTLITDSMAGHLMSMGRVTKTFVGCDRIATNGDFANKIGTYSLAVLCRYHQIPFYVAGPYTTLDRSCATGIQIPIETRKASEVLGVEGSFGSVCWAPEKASVYNPAFDVTPASLVTGWVLDFGVFKAMDFQSGKVRLCMP